MSTHYNIGDPVVISNNGKLQIAVITQVHERNGLFKYDVLCEHGSRFFRISTTSDKKIIFIDKKKTKAIVPKISPTIKSIHSDPVDEPEDFIPFQNNEL